MTVSKRPIASAPIAGEEVLEVLSGGVLAATEPADTAAFVGKVKVIGTFAVTEPADSFAATGIMVNGGVLAVTEPADTAYFTDHVQGDFLNIVEPADSAAFAGVVLIAGTLNATEDADGVLFFAGSVITGTLAVTETGDSALFDWGEPAGGTSRRRRARRTLQKQWKDIAIPLPQVPETSIERMVREIQAEAQRMAAAGVIPSSLGFETQSMREDEEDDAITALLLAE